MRKKNFFEEIWFGRNATLDVESRTSFKKFGFAGVELRLSFNLFNILSLEGYSIMNIHRVRYKHARARGGEHGELLK